MVKRLFIILILTNTMMFSNDIKELNIYEKNCMTCHKPLSISLEKIFFRYLIKYSSEISVKSAMIDFLKNPNIQTSALTNEQRRLIGIKLKTHLKDEELKKAVDIYWKKYKIFDKLW